MINVYGGRTPLLIFNDAYNISIFLGTRTQHIMKVYLNRFMMTNTMEKVDYKRGRIFLCKQGQAHTVNEGCVLNN